MLLLIAENFDALFTFDKNLQYQQNLQKYALPVLVLTASDNTYFTLRNLVPRIKDILSKDLVPGTTIIR
jgi:hypothetical protein